MARYRARGVVLDGKPYIKITEPTDRGEFLVGYFDNLDKITDHGVPVHLDEIEILGDHPHSDPGDGRSECDVCGKWIWPVTHSCKGIPVTAAAEKRWLAPDDEGSA